MRFSLQCGRITASWIGVRVFRFELSLDDDVTTEAPSGERESESSVKRDRLEQPCWRRSCEIEHTLHEPLPASDPEALPDALRESPDHKYFPMTS